MIKLEQYRDLWLSEKMDEVIGFYPREFYPLDNFSSFKVEWNGYLYASLEEAYQAASFMGSDDEIVEKIKHSHSADEAQRIAYANRDKQRKDWDDVKLSVMEELLRLKIEQNPYVKKKLLQTGDYTIVEDSPKDAFWGWGPHRNGENNLGKLWMKLRHEIKKIEETDSWVDDIFKSMKNMDIDFSIGIEDMIDVENPEEIQNNWPHLSDKGRIELYSFIEKYIEMPYEEFEKMDIEEQMKIIGNIKEKQGRIDKDYFQERFDNFFTEQAKTKKILPFPNRLK